MADQQFLASFGVDIDESGVSRLQTILAENRMLGDSLAAAFDAASESVKAFRESISEDFPTLFSGSGYGNVSENLFGDYTGLKIGLNMTEPKKEIAAFTADAKKPIPLSANASSIVSAARTAMEQVRSLFSETFHPECPDGDQYGPEVRKHRFTAGQPKQGRDRFGFP